MAYNPDPCPCGYPTPPVLPIVGVQLGPTDEPALILWNCPGCGTTRSIPWAKASDEQKLEAWMKTREVRRIVR